MQWSASPHDRDHVFGKARAVFRTLEICRLAIKTSVWIQLPIEEACKYFGATASGSSLDDADVTDAFENNHYWKYHYEFIEDDQLMVELHIFFFSFGQVQEFFCRKPKTNGNCWEANHPFARIQQKRCNGALLSRPECLRSVRN